MSICYSAQLRIVIFKSAGIYPLLVVERNSDADRVISDLELTGLLFVNFRFFTALCFFIFLLFCWFLFSFFWRVKHPRKRWDCAANRAVLSVPVGCYFTNSFLAMGLELDALDTGIVQATADNNEVSASFTRSEIRFNSLDFDIVIAERNRLSSKLLAV